MTADPPPVDAPTAWVSAVKDRWEAVLGIVDGDDPSEFDEGPDVAALVKEVEKHTLLGIDFDGGDSAHIRLLRHRREGWGVLLDHCANVALGAVSVQSCTPQAIRDGMIELLVVREGWQGNQFHLTAWLPNPRFFNVLAFRELVEGAYAGGACGAYDSADEYLAACPPHVSRR